MSFFIILLFETDSYSNEYLLAKFGFDTAESTAAATAAENEPCKVCPLSAYRSPRCITGVGGHPEGAPPKGDDGAPQVFRR